MAETAPLGKKPTQIPFKTVETADLKDHYKFAAAGIYANHQYADISLHITGAHRKP